MDDAAAELMAVVGWGGSVPRASVEVPGAPARAKVEGAPAPPETLELAPAGWCEEAYDGGAACGRGGRGGRDEEDGRAVGTVVAVAVAAEGGRLDTARPSAVARAAGAGSGFSGPDPAGWAVRSATSCWMSRDEEASEARLAGPAPGGVDWAADGMEEECASLDCNMAGSGPAAGCAVERDGF